VLRVESLLVQEGLLGQGVLVEVSAEPQGDLFVGVVDGVAAVDDVTSGVDAEVSPDGAGGGVTGVGGSHHGTALLDGVLALPHHGQPGS